MNYAVIKSAVLGAACAFALNTFGHELNEVKFSQVTCKSTQQSLCDDVKQNLTFKIQDEVTAVLITDSNALAGDVLPFKLRKHREGIGANSTFYHYGLEGSPDFVFGPLKTTEVFLNASMTFGSIYQSWRKENTNELETLTIEFRAQ